MRLDDFRRGCPSSRRIGLASVHHDSIEGSARPGELEIPGVLSAAPRHRELSFRGADLLVAQGHRRGGSRFNGTREGPLGAVQLAGRYPRGRSVQVCSHLTGT